MKLKKDKQHRPSPDQKDWERFCIATTGRTDRCAICGKECVPERGHIVPRGRIAPELFDDWDNREPMCRSCNRKYGKKAAPNERLPGWNERFFIAQALKMRPEIRLRVIPEKTGVLRIIENTSQADENTFVIDWEESSIFGPNSEVSETSQTHQFPNQPEAAALVKEMLVEALDAPKEYIPVLGDPKGKFDYIPPRSPSEEQIGKLVKLAMSHTREQFRGAFCEYLLSGIWIEQHGTVKPYLKAAWNSWEDLVNGFETKYLVWWRRRLQAEAKREQKEREKLKLVASPTPTAAVAPNERDLKRRRRESLKQAKIAALAALEKLKEEYVELPDSEHWQRYADLFYEIKNANTDEELRTACSETRTLTFELRRNGCEPSTVREVPVELLLNSEDDTPSETL